jgi:hypothetical protein
MRQKIEMAVRVAALIAVGITPCLVVAQDLPTVSLEDQLKAQYTLVKMGSDSGGDAIVAEGTVLVIKKDGILSVPYGDRPVATKYQDGTVRSPSASTMGARGSLMGRVGKQQTPRLFQVGERVYPSKIAVNLPKDQVTIGIIACDSCNNVSPATFYKADVVFQFPKGALATTSLSQVEDTIAELLNIDDSPGDQGVGQGGNVKGADNGNANANANANATANSNEQQVANPGGGVGQAQQQAPPPEPQQIEKGQTPDQVRAVLGQPDKIVNFGSKQIFIYKDLKVTFLNGKVSDVQ